MCARSSRGDQSVPRPAFSVIRLNCSQTSWSVSGLPVLLQNTRLFSTHAVPAFARSAACLRTSSRNASTAISGSWTTRRDFSVLVSPPNRTER
jgi:hypothetical protein